MQLAPTFDREGALWKQGIRLVAGVDEVGRGPLAGPVAAAAVIMPPRRRFPWLAEVRDSKLLTAAKRERLAACIRQEALAVGLGLVPPERIDELGIVPATRLAMAQALDALTHSAQYVLVDALTLPDLRLPQEAIVHGDALSISIAAASIVAKVERDRMMIDCEQDYPGYGFQRHKGYATPEHLRALRRIGPCPIHRRSFAPVRVCLSGGQACLSVEEGAP